MKIFSLVSNSLRSNPQVPVGMLCSLHPLAMQWILICFYILRFCFIEYRNLLASILSYWILWIYFKKRISLSDFWCCNFSSLSFKRGMLAHLVNRCTLLPVFLFLRVSLPKDSFSGIVFSPPHTCAIVSFPFSWILHMALFGSCTIPALFSSFGCGRPMYTNLGPNGLYFVGGWDNVSVLFPTFFVMIRIFHLR